jgi:hypothetical protein
MMQPFPLTRLAFSAGVLIVRGLWALPWWLLLLLGFFVALSV